MEQYKTNNTYNNTTIWGKHGSLDQNIQFSVHGLTRNIAIRSEIATEVTCWVISKIIYFTSRLSARVYSAVLMLSLAFSFYSKENKSELHLGTVKAAVLNLGPLDIFQGGGRGGSVNLDGKIITNLFS